MKVTVIFKSWSCYLVVTEEDGARPNVSVNITELGSCGHYVAVYRNFLMIGDFFMPMEVPLTAERVKEYVRMAYEKPTDYSKIFPHFKLD